MVSLIHPTALIDPQASLGVGVTVGPYSVIGKHVTIGDGTILHSHVVIEGRTTLGPRCTVFPFASIGHNPQDLKYAGEPSTLIVGEGTCIREYVTLQPGTRAGKMETVVGRNCLLMASSHVAHDCCLGDNVILANAATLGGHVVLGSYVTIGGLSAIHQFVRVGEHAMIGGTAGIVGDVIPYGMVNPEGKLNGLNITGLKRRDFSKETIQALRKAYHYLFSSGTATIADRLNSLSKDLLSYTPVQNLINFISKEERRPLCLP